MVGQDVASELVVDAHLHFWAWRESAQAFVTATDQPISPDSFAALMDENGVVRGIQVTRVFQPDDSESIDGARSFPSRFRVLGRPGRDAFRNPRCLESWWRPDEVVGMRIFPGPSDPDLFVDELLPFWATVQELDIPVSIYVPGRLDDVVRLATAFPRIRFVLDHAGLWLRHSVPRQERLTEWEVLRDFVDLPGVLVKASGLPEATEETSPFPRAADLLAEVVDTFGASRVMWGSNFTPAGKVGAYAQHVQFARDATRHLSEPAREAVLSGTATALFWTDDVLNANREDFHA